METTTELHDRLDTYIQQTPYDCEPDDQYDTLAPNIDDMRAQLEFVFGGVPDDHRGLIEIATRTLGATSIRRSCSAPIRSRRQLSSRPLKIAND
ncbi:MAG: hypothetical protein WB495_27350 [Xanthobacteraceae bacterium]